MFREDDVRNYLETKRQLVTRPALVGVQHEKISKFEPLNPINLARSVERTLLEAPLKPLMSLEPFDGAGVYCLYYSGSDAPYSAIADDPPRIPIYVGSATSGRRRVGRMLNPSNQPLLYNRLRGHVAVLQQVEHLRVDDFTCRFLVIDDMWSPLAEELLVHHFRPAWNVVAPGFGNHDPGSGRRGPRSDWDELHPGRPWAVRQAPARRSRDEILAVLAAHLIACPLPDFSSTPDDGSAAHSTAGSPHEQ